MMEHHHVTVGPSALFMSEVAAVIFQLTLFQLTENIIVVCLVHPFNSAHFISISLSFTLEYLIGALLSYLNIAHSFPL